MNLDINLNIIFKPEEADVVSILRQLFRKVEVMSNILDTLTVQVAAVKTVNDSAITLLNGLHAKLDEAIANGDTAELQALSDSLGADTQALADAVSANTVADPAHVG
jgi:hypothetical protein